MGKKTLSEVILDKRLCLEASNNFLGKTLEESLANPGCGIDWISTFTSSMVGEAGWPTKKQLIEKALSEINLVKNDYTDPAETWIQPSLNAVQSWINGTLSDNEMFNMGFSNFEKVRTKTGRDSKTLFCKSVAFLTMAPKNIKNITFAFVSTAMAIVLDPNKNQKRKDTLINMTTRFDLESLVGEEAKDNIV